MQFFFVRLTRLRRIEWAIQNVELFLGETSPLIIDIVWRELVVSNVKTADYGDVIASPSSIPREETAILFVIFVIPNFFSG